jgi:phosphocarrier protein HPr
MCVSSTSNDYAERTVEIRNAEGLHMRPAMQFVDCANGFKSKIRVEKDSQVVDGKSIMQVTMLAATQGTKLKIIASGSDAQKAVDTLGEFLERSTLEKPVQDQEEE